MGLSAIFAADSHSDEDISQYGDDPDEDDGYQHEHTVFVDDVGEFVGGDCFDLSFVQRIEQPLREDDSAVLGSPSGRECVTTRRGDDSDFWDC